VEGHAQLQERVAQAPAAEPEERKDHDAAATGTGLEAGFKVGCYHFASGSQGNRPAPAGVVPARAGPTSTSIGLCGGCWGAAARCRRASIARLKASAQAEYEMWKTGRTKKARALTNRTLAPGI